MDGEKVYPDSYDWSIPPTQKELDSLISLLKDFCITADVPKFKTREEMSRWRRSIINNMLQEII